jgi:hypothetical protein
VTSYMICYQIRLDNNVLAVPNKVPLVRTSSRSIPRKEISCAYGTATFTNGPMCARPGYAHLLPPPPKEENDRPSPPGGCRGRRSHSGRLHAPIAPYCSNHPCSTSPILFQLSTAHSTPIGHHHVMPSAKSSSNKVSFTQLY